MMVKNVKLIINPDNFLTFFYCVVLQLEKNRDQKEIRHSRVSKVSVKNESASLNNEKETSGDKSVTPDQSEVPKDAFKQPCIEVDQKIKNNSGVPSGRATKTDLVRGKKQANTSASLKSDQTQRVKTTDRPKSSAGSRKVPSIHANAPFQTNPQLLISKMRSTYQASTAKTLSKSKQLRTGSGGSSQGTRATNITAQSTNVLGNSTKGKSVKPDSAVDEKENTASDISSHSGTQSPKNHTQTDQQKQFQKHLKQTEKEMGDMDLKNKTVKSSSHEAGKGDSASKEKSFLLERDGYVILLLNF